jgi:hypothetical protein
MKHLKLLFASMAFVTLFITATPTRAQMTNSIPSELRAGNFSCDKATIDTALAIKHAGWTHIMPQPKSPQAAWGNRDGRTTWWVGYWINVKTDSTSSIQPTKDNTGGQWVGDSKGVRYWRRGGSPPRPTKIEWLCSNSDGIPPE